MSQLMTGSNTDLASVTAEAEARYVAANPESKRRHDAAVAHMPGGNTRTVLFYSPFPAGAERRPGLPASRTSTAMATPTISANTRPGSTAIPIRCSRRRCTRSSMTASRWAATTSTRPSWRRRCAGASRRSSGCVSAIPAPRATCSPSRRRGCIPAAPPIMVFHGAYHGGVFYFGQQKSPINAPFPWIIGHYNDIEFDAGADQQERARSGRRADRADDGRRRRHPGRSGVPQGDPQRLLDAWASC